MDLYFAPMSCSLAARISLYELEIPATFRRVGLTNKRLDDGSDYLPVNVKGQVPTLVLDDGTVLTEGPAVLQYLADLDPSHRLAPAAGEIGRYRLQQWLNYVSTEVHKAVFYMMFNPESPPETKTFVRERLLPKRFDYLSDHLSGRDYLMDSGFSVADAYLFSTLNWALSASVGLQRWPVLVTYRERCLERPAVARAVAEELALQKVA
jgi:glutathione S-transferase